MQTPRRAAWLGLLSAAALVFGSDLGREALWLDETFSWAIVQHGPRRILEFTAADVHPPLYYLALKAVMVAFGASPAVLRALSALAALALVALGAGPVRHIFGERAAYLYAALAVTSPGLIAFAQEARMYTLLAASVTAAVLYGWLAIAEGRRRDFIVYGACNAVAAYTHHYGALALALAALALAGLARAAHRERIWPLLAAQAASVALYLPWAPSTLAQVLRVSREFWIPAPGATYVAFAWVAPFTYKFEDIAYPWTALASALAGSALAAFAAFQFWRRRDLVRLSALGLIAGVHLGTLTLALSYSWTVQPVLMPRYMIGCLGLFLLAVAVGLAALPARFGYGVGVALVVLNLPAAWRVLGERFNGPFRELAAAVGHDARDTLVHTDLQTLYPSWHALPHARHLLAFPPDAEPWDPGQGVYASARASGSNDPIAALGAERTVWLVDMVNGTYHLPASSFESHGYWRQGSASELDLPWSWVKIRLSKFERK